MRHPEHDRIAAMYRARYRTSFPDLGYHVEHRRFGYYRRHTSRADFAHIVVDGAGPADVPALLADAREFYGGQPVDIWLEAEEVDLLLGKLLMEAGCVRGTADVYLAHVGEAPAVVQVPGKAVEQVTEKTLEEFAVAKLKAFANRECSPTAADVEREVALRSAEMNGIGRFAIARVGRIAAAIIGCYAGEDWLVFTLATRVPFRGRGIAAQLLLGALADARRERARSVTINTDPDDTPIRWYTRIGFTDPVYWYRAYRYDPRVAATEASR
jgi:ribosomal protein S18 acetylase RimI-like enzyme